MHPHLSESDAHTRHSIFLQSTNERCNYLRSVLGIFFHTTSVPEKVIKTLAHAGLSISLTSVHHAVTLKLQKTSEKQCAT